MKTLKLIPILLVLFFSPLVFAKKVTYKKTQDVSFDGSDVDGQVRNPDGSYLLQKRGIDFMPLYKVRSSFDENIKESFEYLR